MRVLAALALAVTVIVPSAGTAQANGSDYTFALIGDVPYGATEIAAFPHWIEQINADPAVRSVVHLGDIKNGSSVCSDSYFSLIRSDVDGFVDPFVYTPGDNEWTDCHRANNGAYNPLERLDAVRRTFFDHPGTTLGKHAMTVEAEPGIAENVIYHRADVTFVTANVPGSDNAMQPWAGLGQTAPTPEQTDAYNTRNSLNIAELHQAFAEAKAQGDHGVVVMQQADMFDPTYTPTANDIAHFASWIQALIDESNAFGGQVYLLNGDSHLYNTDQPLAAGSSWRTTYAAYGVTGAADNLTRITVDGSSNADDYLRVTVGNDPSAPLLTWTRVPYTS
ncbi:hypothetical protein [Nocardioides montaniterrae]